MRENPAHYYIKLVNLQQTEGLTKGRFRSGRLKATTKRNAALLFN